ncbi:MAG: hypothetical protein HYY16_07810 [Planctomycetes bacterium]|nr:hypothetical protein [Planctomycetota bacterium]
MEQRCPGCGQEVDPREAPGLKGGCPNCLAKLMLEEETSPLQPGTSFRGMEVVERRGVRGCGDSWGSRSCS